MEQQLNISFGSVQKIEKQLEVKPYKIQIVQIVQAEYFDRRYQLASSFIVMSQMNPVFNKN